MIKCQEQVVIIGNGVAGITAARHIRKSSDKKIMIISGESDYFFSRTALMYVFMGHLTWKNIEPYAEWFWKKNRIRLKKAKVAGVNISSQCLSMEDGEEIHYDTLILATGSIPRKMGWEGEDLKGVQGLVSKQDLELLEENSRKCEHAVIVGGGLIGVELAEMLTTREIKVSMMIRETAFWGNVLPETDARFISRHIASHGISLFHETELDKIIGNDTGRVQAVVTTKGDKLSCGLVGLSIGVRPNISFLNDSGIATDQGILVDPYLRTNVENIYAIGDCAQHKEPKGDRSSVEAVWYTARMMGETVAQTICDNPFRYNPGHWFNSAKFFDIEYQTYGRVWPEPKENEQHLHWEHKDGTRAVTIAYNTQTQKFLGINTYGIRMRHEVFDQWLTQENSIQHVLSNLKKANFDPEFYSRYEREIFRSFKEDII